MPRQNFTSIPPHAFIRFAGHAVIAFALAVALSACAPSALSTARSQIAAANYPAARQELVALSVRTDLNESQRREVKDDLCLVDFKIGRPTYSLAEQRGVCLDAMVARCGCDARTNVAVAETGFPAYFIRLDPETKISEVMILPRGDSGIVAASSN